MSTRDRILAEARLRSDAPNCFVTVNRPPSKIKPITWFIATMVCVLFVGQIGIYWRDGEIQDKIFVMELTMGKIEKELKINVETMSDLKNTMRDLNLKLSEDVNKITSTALNMNQEIKGHENSLKNDIIRLNEASVTLKNDAVEAKMLLSDIKNINSQTAGMKCKLKVDEYVSQVTSYLKDFNDE